MHGFVTQAAHSREQLGPRLAPSQKGGGRVWGTRPLRLAPVLAKRVRSGRG
jgi:hypothetical protein